jgi:flagellar hook-length control protein FliK
VPTGGANPSLDNLVVEQIKSALETAQKQVLPRGEKAAIENRQWLMPTGDKIDSELQPKWGGKIFSPDNGVLGKDGGDGRQQVLFSERPGWHPANPAHQQPQQAGEKMLSSHLPGQQLPDIQSKIQADSEVKPSHSDTRAIKETSIDILKQGQTEGLNLKNGDLRPAIPVESAGKNYQEVAPTQSLGGQLAQNDEQEAGAFTRQEARDNIKLNLQSSHHQPQQLEILTDPAGEEQEAPQHPRHIPRDTLNPAAQKTSIGSDRGVEHVSAKGEWTPAAGENQSNVIRQIVQRMTLRTRGSQQTMSIRLKPEYLGHLHMQVSTDNQQVVVRMAAESVAVKEMIEQGLQYLKSELQHHGLEIDKFDVFVANDDDETGGGQDWAAFQQRLKERRQGRSGHSDDDNTGEKSDQTAAVQQPSAGAPGEIDYFA